VGRTDGPVDFNQADLRGLGANRIAASLRMAAVGLRNTKSALGAAYRRIARHRGADVAVFAMARRLAQLVYRMLRYGQDYIDIGEMAGVGRPGQSGEHATLPVPQVLLMEVLELREALAEAHAAKDASETEALVAKVRGRLETVMDEVAKGFLASPPELTTLAARLVTVRYYRRFLDEARTLWEEDTPVPRGRSGDGG